MPKSDIPLNAAHGAAMLDREISPEDTPMPFILGATASDDASEFKCDYAVVDLTPELARKILARMDALMMLYSRDRSLHEFHFWDTDATQPAS